MAKGADFMMARRGIMDSVFPSIEKAARIVSGVERLCLGRRSLAARSLRQQLCGKGRNHISRQGLRWPGFARLWPRARVGHALPRHPRRLLASDLFLNNHGRPPIRPRHPRLRTLPRHRPGDGADARGHSAREALSEPLPAGWERHLNEDYQMPFFWSETAGTCWGIRCSRTTWHVLTRASGGIQAVALVRYRAAPGPPPAARAVRPWIPATVSYGTAGTAATAAAASIPVLSTAPAKSSIRRSLKSFTQCHLHSRLHGSTIRSRLL